MGAQENRKNWIAHCRVLSIQANNFAEILDEKDQKPPSISDMSDIGELIIEFGAGMESLLAMFYIMFAEVEDTTPEAFMNIGGFRAVRNPELWNTPPSGYS